MKRLARGVGAGITLLGSTGLLLASESSDVARVTPANWHPTTLGGALLATVAFGFAGIFLAIAGFKLFDAFTKFDLEKEICDNRNMAAAVLCGAMLLGIGLIVAAAIIG